MSEAAFTIPMRPVRDAAAPFIRTAAAIALAEINRVRVTGRSANVLDVAAKLWPRDEATAAVTRAATSPTSTANATALLQTSLGAFLGSLAPSSAAAQLMADGLIPMGSAATTVLPSVVMPAPGFVAEGAPIPVRQGTVAGVSLGPVGKLAFIAALTAELAGLGPEGAENVVGIAMRQAGAAALDGELFSATAGSDDRSAGLRYGVLPSTGAVGGGLDALVADLKTLVAAIVNAGGGTRIVFVMRPEQALFAKTVLPAGFDFPILTTTGLPTGTVLALDAAAFASGFRGDVELDASTVGVLHMDTSPTAISATGTPNTVAAPVRSLFQTNSIALRAIVRAAWTMRGSGLVAVVESVSW